MFCSGTLRVCQKWFECADADFSFSAVRARSHAIFMFSKRERYAKFWLEPIELAESRGFRSSELSDLHKLIESTAKRLLLAWDEHFDQ